MAGQQMDRIARSLAGEVSRRGVIKPVAVALGLLAGGGLHAPTAAKPQWCRCYYECDPGLPAGLVGRCIKNRCPRFIWEQGEICPILPGNALPPLIVGGCGFSSEAVCLSRLI